MKIKAESKYDFESMKALTYAAQFKKGKPKICMVFYMVIYALLAALVITEMILFGADTLLIIQFVLICLLVLIQLFTFFLLPGIRYKKMGKMKDMKNEFLFTDENIEIKSGNSNYSGQAVLQYSYIHKVYETGKYFFIFQNRASAFIVEKNTITGGTAENIRKKLSSVLGKKYKLCRY